MHHLGEMEGKLSIVDPKMQWLVLGEKKVDLAVAPHSIFAMNVIHVA